MQHHTVSSTPVLDCDLIDVVGVRMSGRGGAKNYVCWKGGAHYHVGRVVLMLERWSSSCWKGGAHHVGRVELMLEGWSSSCWKGGAHYHVGRVELIIMLEGWSSSCWKGGAHYHVGRVELIIMLEGWSSLSCWKGGASNHAQGVELNSRSSHHQLSAALQIHRFT